MPSSVLTETQESPDNHCINSAGEQVELEKTSTHQGHIKVKANDVNVLG